MAICRQTKAQTIPDSVLRQYKAAKTNKEKLYSLYSYVDVLRRDSTFLQKTQPLIDFLGSENDTRSRDFIQLSINDHLSKIGDYAKSLSSTLDITTRFEQQKDTSGILAAYRQLSSGYYYAGDREKDLVFGKKALLIAQGPNNPVVLSGIANNISTSYAQKNNADSALLYAQLAVDYARKSGDIRDMSMVMGTLSEAFIAAKQYDSALICARQSLSYDRQTNPDELMLVWTLNDLSQIFLETDQLDSSKYYAHKAIEISAAIGFKDQLQRAYEYLSRAFDKTQKSDSAFKYLQLAVTIKDSLYNVDKTNQVQGIFAREQLRLQDLENEKIKFRNKMRSYGLAAGLVILSIVAFLLYRNNWQKQKANKKLTNTLSELKSTQSQLIHSEKMASLGELTAGIAHEIQNPLNFVNNFSEINGELIEEVSESIENGKSEGIKNMLRDIKDNSEKINHHGKRADAIVKGMLQHSRSSSGKKEPTDINALAEEYLKLAYHGLRAKDKSFNATIKTDFDSNVGIVNIIPQDIGRVILNLITNAFYAVTEKKKLQPDGYEPTVSVSSKKINDTIELIVKDNGNGISPNIINKVFQPFFTTKPTGQGTGLGLSLAYDIVKTHGGELKIETEEGEGAIFTMKLNII